MLWVRFFYLNHFWSNLNVWKASYSSVSLILLFLRAGSKAEASCWSEAETKGFGTTPANHWNERPIQTLLVVKNCLCYHKFTYDSLGSITAVKPIELETAPKFCSAENANISLKWHSFVKWAAAGKLMRVLIILERAREEWRTLKDFTVKLGVRGWISPNFKRHQIRRQGCELETGLLLYCNPDISLVD